ncbi:unnamed protein product [Rotaria magnacalcarata]
MNLAMQHPVAYPFYMDSPRLRFSLPWPSNPFQYPSHSQQYYSSSYQLSPSLTPISYPLPFILSHPVRAPNPPPKPMQSYSSYTNTRYNHLKQSTSHMNRHRSMDPSLHSQHYSISNHQYQPSKATSISDLHQLSNQNSTHLLKAHSWHTMNYIHQPNKNINFAKEIPLIHDKQHNHFYSPKQKKKIHKLQLSPLSPIQKQLPETGIVRISTLDEMPTIHNPIYRENIVTSNIHDNNNNNNNKNKNKSRQKKSNNKSSSTSPSTNSSHSSFQKLLNGTLLHDPLLTAAMEDFRQLHRTSSQSTPLTPHNRDLSRDSLCSESTHHSSSSSSSTTATSSSSSSSSSSSISRCRSQSSFTSLERLEIRRLIKSLKKNGLQSLTVPIPTSSKHLPPPKQPINKTLSSSTTPSICKPEKSSITEELERKFNKLRSSNPNQELIYVKPSSITKQKEDDASLQNDEQGLPKKQIETIDILALKQINDNPTISIPISQSMPKQSSDIMLEEKKQLESTSEYAVPVKKTPNVSRRETKKDEQMRSFSFCKPIHDIDNEMRPTRPLSMFNWFHCGVTNPLPATFQPNKFKTNDVDNEYDKALVKENIYASDIDVHIPISNDKNFLNDQSMMTDYFSDCKQTTHSSSILSDFSRLFTRFGNHKHEQKSKLKRKLHKNNNHNNSRCSIM